MDVREIIGLLTGIIVLAGLSVAIVNGGNTAAVLSSAAGGFATVIGAATLNQKA